MFTNAFWSPDYATGIEALIRALSISTAENKQFLLMVEQRARIEKSMASSLAQLSQDPAMHAVPVQSDAYVAKTSTLQSALHVFTSETVSQAVVHTQIASDLESRVRLPLQKWCDSYALKVDQCNTKLNSLVSGYKQLVQAVNKKRQIYYEQCQKFEDRGVSGGSPKDPIIKTIRMLREHWAGDTLASPKPRKSNSQLHDQKKVSADASSNKQNSEDSLVAETHQLAGLSYTTQELADILVLILQDVTLEEYRVPLLGSYKNVTSGSVVGTATRKHLKNDSFAYAEKFGQSLVDEGFLKPVGQISNKFHSTHNSHYQFQPSAFSLLTRASSASVSGPNPESTITTEHSASSSPSTTSSRSVSGNYGTTDVSEEHYLQSILELDVYRCEMEKEIVEIYQFLDKLEQGREEAIKRGMDDYIRLAFRPEEQRNMQIRMHGAQSQIDPLADVHSLTLKNQTGPFIPTVTVFQGYTSGSYVQTFGVDLTQSSFLVDIVLDWLPTLPEQETRSLLLWTKPAPISEIYKLRAQINNGKDFAPDSIFRFFTLSVVISTLRQYLLELPESVISFIIYERVKQLYAQDPDERMVSPSNASFNTSTGSLSPPPIQSNGLHIQSENPTCTPVRPSDSSSLLDYDTSKELVEEEFLSTQATASPKSIAAILIQIPHLNRLVLKRIILYLRDRYSPSSYADLASSLALPLIRPRAPSAVNINDTHPSELLLDLLISGPEVFAVLDIKQKEMDSVRVNRNHILALPTTPNSAYAEDRLILSQSSVDSGSSSFFPSTPYARASSLVGDSTNSSGNKGMRPLSMSQTPRTSNFSNHKSNGSRSHILGLSVPDSPNRSSGVHPIVSLTIAPSLTPDSMDRPRSLILNKSASISRTSLVNLANDGDNCDTLRPSMIRKESGELSRQSY